MDTGNDDACSVIRKLRFLVILALMAWLGNAHGAGKEGAREQNIVKDKAVALFRFDQKTPPKRKRVTDRTYVFSRSQTQYNLYRNYLNNHYMIKRNDRPLFYNRDLWLGDDKNVESFNASAAQDIRIAATYGLDGLAALMGGSQFYRKGRMQFCDAYDQLNPKDSRLLVEISPDAAQLNYDFIEPIERAIRSPCAFTINGKKLITSYCADLVTDPDSLGANLAATKKKLGDKFLFVADIRAPSGLTLKSWPAFEEAFFKNKGAVPLAEVEALKVFLRGYLDVCDGIMFAGSNHMNNQATGGHQFNEKFYRDFLIPCFVSVLSEDKYHGKLMGLSASVGYVNRFSGAVILHDGTRQLRQSLQAALDASPDFILMPEWNEFNENTALSPTLQSSTASQRIVKYFVGRNKGLAPVPNPGDDPEMPDLIVSGPVSLKKGDQFFIELLNVPNQVSEESYQVAVSLASETGREIIKYPPVTLNRTVLEEKRLYLPTENLGDCAAICTTLTILTSKGDRFTFDEGLCPAILYPTYNSNYCSVRQPLQDLAKLDTCEFNVRQEAGEAIFSAKARSLDSIATAEIVENDTELYGVDSKDEYKLNAGEALVFMYWESRRDTDGRNAEVAINISGGEIRHMENKNRGTDACFPEPLIRTGASSARLDYARQNNQRRRGAFFIITNKDEAVIEVDVKTIGQTFSIPVKDVVDAVVYAKQFAQKGFMLRFEAPPRRQMDIPMVNRKEIEFSAEIAPLSSDSVFYLRIVTENGEIFRSRPRVLAEADQGGMVKIPVFSETEGKVVAREVKAGAIPDIGYLFSPRHGSALVSDYGYSWNAEAGGGMAYNGPFYATRRGPLLDLAGPVWVEQDGSSCLKFNGRNNYICFPNDVIPARSSFTAVFDIYPTSEKRQQLLCLIESVHLYVENGELALRCHDESKKLSLLKSGIRLPLNAWSRVTFGYRLGEGFQITVNDQSSGLIAFGVRLKELYQQATFGGLGDRDFFEGYLRSFRVVHLPPNSAKRDAAERKEPLPSGELPD